MIESDSSVAVETPLTVVAQRRFRRGAEADFDQAMHEFTRFAMNFRGHDGITVLRSGAAGGDFVVVDRFRVIFDACVVGLLSWGVMPLITRLLSGWLFGEEK